jgi:hypothetical protein
MMQSNARMSDLTVRWRSLGPLGQGTVAGALVGALLMLWLALALLTGPGATWRILLPALLFLLPVLGLTALAGLIVGWLARLALRRRRV